MLWELRQGLYKHRCLLVHHFLLCTENDVCMQTPHHVYLIMLLKYLGSQEEVVTFRQSHVLIRHTKILSRNYFVSQTPV